MEMTGRVIIDTDIGVLGDTTHALDLPDESIKCIFENDDRFPEDSVPDPYAYVISANIHRRHLTVEQRKNIAAKLLAARPGKSDRAVAEQVSLSKNTVAAARAAGEARGQIDHVSTRTDSAGRQQPAHKPAGQSASERRRALLEPNPDHVMRPGEKVFVPPGTPLSVNAAVEDGNGPAPLPCDDGACANSKLKGEKALNYVKHLIVQHLAPDERDALIEWYEAKFIIPAIDAAEREQPAGSALPQ
jgi:hypothetical protein